MKNGIKTSNNKHGAPKIYNSSEESKLNEINKVILIIIAGEKEKANQIFDISVRLPLFFLYITFFFAQNK